MNSNMIQHLQPRSQRPYRPPTMATAPGAVEADPPIGNTSGSTRGEWVVLYRLSDRFAEPRPEGAVPSARERSWSKHKSMRSKTQEALHNMVTEASMLMTWRRLQPAGSRLVSTLVPQTSGRRDESRRGTQECVRHVLTPATVFCEAPVSLFPVQD